MSEDMIRERRANEIVFRPAGTKAEDIHSYTKVDIICPTHQREMLIRDNTDFCYCPAPGCELEVIIRLRTLNELP